MIGKENVKFLFYAITTFGLWTLLNNELDVLK